MKITPLLSILAAAAITAACNNNSTDQSNSSTNAPSAAATNVDNTGINARDRGNTNVTALDQGNSSADVQLTASIRKAVVSTTNNFSMAARNIKIITQNGKVTLRGPVNTDAEKTQI